MAELPRDQPGESLEMRTIRDTLLQMKESMASINDKLTAIETGSRGSSRGNRRNHTNLVYEADLEEERVPKPKVVQSYHLESFDEILERLIREDKQQKEIERQEKEENERKEKAENERLEREREERERKEREKAELEREEKEAIEFKKNELALALREKEKEEIEKKLREKLREKPNAQVEIKGKDSERVVLPNPLPCSSLFLQIFKLERPIIIHLPIIPEVPHFEFVIGDRDFCHTPTQVRRIDCFVATPHFGQRDFVSSKVRTPLHKFENQSGRGSKFVDFLPRVLLKIRGRIFSRKGGMMKYQVANTSDRESSDHCQSHEAVSMAERDVIKRAEEMVRDPLIRMDGPMTRARARRLKTCLSTLIHEAHAQEEVKIGNYKSYFVSLLQIVSDSCNSCN